MLFVATQVVFPFAAGGIASAAASIGVSTSQGQEFPSLTWSSGNITTYQEGDFINFRFDVSTSGASSGQMKVQYANDECGFFDGSFALLTTTNTSGATPTVAKVGPSTLVGSDWEQVLSVNFTGAGTDTINYKLKLGQDAGQCNGSSTHVVLDNVNGPAGGDFSNIGALTVPIPAKDIIELPEIFVTKKVDTNGDGVSDRNATAGEWSFSLDGGTPVATDANGQVTFTNVIPNGTHIITEVNGPPDQSFLSGSGSGCTFNGSTATATVQSGTTSTDATCVFTNTVKKGSITIVKDATPDSTQVFHFSTTTNSSVFPAFDLDDDGSNVNAHSNTQTYSNLLSGTYTVTEDNTPGWDFSSLSCNNAAGAVSGKTATITITSGQNVVCTYGNTQQGTITVNKSLSPTNDPGKFNLQINGVTAGTGANVGNGGTTGTQSYSAGGSFTVGETQGNVGILSDYTSSYTCLDNGNSLVSGSGTLSSSFSLGAGHNVVCTFTNTRNTGSVTVNKMLRSDATGSFLPANPGIFTWGLDSGATTNAMGSTLSSINTGSHSVAENSVTGYHPVGWYLTSDTQHSCLNPTSSTFPIDVAVTTGQTASVTICNARDTGTLQVLKNVDLNADGDFSDPGETNSDAWQWQANGGTNHTTGDAPIAVVTDNYTLTETGSTDYHNTGFSCTGGIYNGTTVTVATGDNAVCTFVNVRNTGLISFLKNVVGGTASASDWLFTVSDAAGTTAHSGDSRTILTGSYGVLESGGPIGYTLTTDNTPGNVCTLSNGIITLMVSQAGGLCSITNTRDTGSVKVNKLLDNDGNGTFELTNPGDFSWNIDTTPVSTNNAMGTTLPGVETNPYHVTENSPANYHPVGWFTGSPTSTQNPCTNLTNTTLPAGINVTKDQTTEITLCNARDTGTVTVNKSLVPASDSGKFNLNINGITKTAVGGVGDGGTTGAVIVPTAAAQTASETAAPGTSLDDYTSSWTCTNGLAGDGTTTTVFSVVTSENVTCTFINVRKASLTITKDANPDSDQDFTFTLGQQDPNDLQSPATIIKSFILDDDADATHSNTEQTTSLVPGTYVIDEAATTGWDLTNVNCGEGIQFSRQDGTITLTIAAGANITCTFTNTQRGSITIIKDAQPDSDQAFTFTGNLTGDNGPNFTLTDNGSLDGMQQRVFNNMPQGTYTVTEPNNVKGWDLTDITCVGGSDKTTDTHERNAVIKLKPGENVTCTFTNEAVPPTIKVIKHVINDDGGAMDASNFTMHVTSNDTEAAHFPGDEAGTTTAVAVGSYSVDEDQLPGYTASFSEGCSGTVELGDKVTCTITNNDNPASLTITKSNDQVGPASVGDDVTYTLTITNPDTEEHPGGVVYNTAVTDLPPDNFEYVAGSWSASSTVPEHNVGTDISEGSPTHEPTYGSPGVWHIGTMLPGEVITLLYHVHILQNVTAGTYPDLAFARGATQNSTVVLAGCTGVSCVNASGTPFVGTQVSLALATVPPKVFTASKVSELVNTGQPILPQQVIVPILLLLGAYITRRAAPRSLSKGGRL